MYGVAYFPTLQVSIQTERLLFLRILSSSRNLHDGHFKSGYFDRLRVGRRVDWSVPIESRTRP